MSMTEPERHELYELAKRDVSERFAELMIKAPPHDVDRLATKEDLAVLSAQLRQEMAELRVEMRELTASQTRTVMLGLVGSITALTVAEILTAAL